MLILIAGVVGRRGADQTVRGHRSHRSCASGTIFPPALATAVRMTDSAHRARCRHGPSLTTCAGAPTRHNAAGDPLAPLAAADAEQRYLAHETLLRFVLEALVPYLGRIPMDALLADVVAQLMAVPTPCPCTWAELEASVSVPSNVWSKSAPDAEYVLSQTLLKPPMAAAISAEVAWRALRLLAVLNLRLRPEWDQCAKVLERAAHLTSQTVLTVPAFLHARRDQPLAQTLGEFIKQRVLDRHLPVAFAVARRRLHLTCPLPPYQSNLGSPGF